MLDLVIFAVTLVVAQCVAGFIMYKIMMKMATNKEYLKKMSKTMLEVSKELVEEMEDDF